MGLFCGKVCKCKNRCESYFPGIPFLIDACKSACKGDSSMNRDKFLCSGNFVDQQSIILQLGYDPCLGDEIDFGDTVAGQAAGADDRQWERLQPIFLGLGLLIVAALAIVYVIRR